MLKATLGEAASTKRKRDKEQEGGSELAAGKRPAHEPFWQLRAADNKVFWLSECSSTTVAAYEPVWNGVADCCLTPQNPSPETGNHPVNAVRTPGVAEPSRQNPLAHPAAPPASAGGAAAAADTGAACNERLKGLRPWLALSDWFRQNLSLRATTALYQPPARKGQLKSRLTSQLHPTAQLLSQKHSLTEGNAAALDL